MHAPSAFLPAAVALAAAAASGCLAIKTEHEVRPIQITMDVNLRVDKAVEAEIDKEIRTQPKDFEHVRDLVSRGAVGLDARGYLAGRETLPAEDADLIEDLRAKRRARMAELAEKEGVSRADVESARAKKMLERMPEGTWHQDASGEWKQK